MAGIAEIGRCQQCGKLQNKHKLHPVEELFGRRNLCVQCYQKYQRSLWGYW